MTDILIIGAQSQDGDVNPSLEKCFELANRYSFFYNSLDKNSPKNLSNSALFALMSGKRTITRNKHVKHRSIATLRLNNGADALVMELSKRFPEEKFHKVYKENYHPLGSSSYKEITTIQNGETSTAQGRFFLNVIANEMSDSNCNYDDTIESVIDFDIKESVSKPSVQRFEHWLHKIESAPYGEITSTIQEALDNGLPLEIAVIVAKTYSLDKLKVNQVFPSTKSKFFEKLSPDKEATISRMLMDFEMSQGAQISTKRRFYI